MKQTKKDIMETNESLFSLVFLFPRTIDSQKHIVNSKEEFDRYYDIEKAKKLYHEAD